MKTKKREKSPIRMDAFISHASEDSTLAARIEKALEDDGLSAWLDRSEIRVGVLLRNELQAAIQNSSVVILLWSESAASSRWVAAELLTTFHLDRFIVPCVLDGTQLPQFLQNTVYLDLRQDKGKRIKSLCRAVRQAPNSANVIPPIMYSQSEELKQTIQAIYQGQTEVLKLLEDRNIDKARKVYKIVDKMMKNAEKVWRLDPWVINLAGYHRKNAYMLKHWDAIQAGRPPKDPFLERAERFFFEALFVNPIDHSALNGLGSILIFERDLDAAEFFIRRAISLAQKEGIDYSAAQQDLAMILQFKKKK